MRVVHARLLFLRYFSLTPEAGWASNVQSRVHFKLATQTFLVWVHIKVHAPDKETEDPQPPDLRGFGLDRAGEEDSDRRPERLREDEHNQGAAPPEDGGRP